MGNYNEPLVTADRLLQKHGTTWGQHSMAGTKPESTEKKSFQKHLMGVGESCIPKGSKGPNDKVLWLRIRVI